MKTFSSNNCRLSALLFLCGLLAWQCSKATAPDLDQDPHLKMAHIFDGSGALLLALKELEIAKQNKENPKKVQEFSKALLERRKKAAVTLADLQVALKNQMEWHRYHRFYYQTGICYEILDQKGKALSAYTKSLSLRPLPLAYVQRALFFLGTRQARPAMQDLKSALAIEEDYPRALFFQGLLFAMTQKKVGAKESLSKIRKHRPQYAAVLGYYLRHPKHAGRMLAKKPPSILDLQSNHKRQSRSASLLQHSTEERKER